MPADYLASVRRRDAIRNQDSQTEQTFKIWDIHIDAWNIFSQLGSQWSPAPMTSYLQPPRITDIESAINLNQVKPDRVKEMFDDVLTIIIGAQEVLNEK